MSRSSASAHPFRSQTAALDAPRARPPVRWRYAHRWPSAPCEVSLKTCPCCNIDTPPSDRLPSKKRRSAKRPVTESMHATGRQFESVRGLGTRGRLHPRATRWGMQHPAGSSRAPRMDAWSRPNTSSHGSPRRRPATWRQTPSRTGSTRSGRAFMPGGNTRTTIHQPPFPLTIVRGRGRAHHRRRRPRVRRLPRRVHRRPLRPLASGDPRGDP